MAMMGTGQRLPLEEKAAFTRKQYRIAVDSIRRLDQAIKVRKSVETIQKAECCLARDRLQDSCEKLLFAAPLEFGKKAEDQIWRKCFYEPIQIIRESKSRMSNQQRSWAIMFLESAVGYYLGFVSRLQRHFNVKLAIDLAYKPCCSTEVISAKEQLTAESRSWGVQAIKKSIIYLGDLLRYTFDITGADEDFYMAEHYYLEAYAMDNNYGMAMNQLGTLVGQANGGIDALFYYFRGLLCVDRFEGTKANINYAFKRAKLNRDQVRENDIDKATGRDNFCSSLMEVLQMFFDDTFTAPGEFASAVQRALSGFEAVLKAEEDHTLKREVLIKVVVLLMMFHHHLRKEESPKLRACVLFVLDHISILFSRLAEHWKAFCDGYVLQPPLTDCTEEGSPLQPTVSEDAPSKEAEIADAAEPSVKKVRRRPPLALLRRRRGRTTSTLSETEEDQQVNVRDSSDSSSSNTDQAYNEDSGEDIVEIASGGESGHSRSSENCDEKTTPDVTTAPPVEEPTVIKSDEPPSTDLLLRLIEWGWVDVVKVISDWLVANPDVLKVQALHPLHRTFNGLVDVLPTQSDLMHRLSPDEVSQLGSLCSDSWQQPFPLPEDFQLRGIPVFGDLQSRLFLDAADVPQLSTVVQLCVRLVVVDQCTKRVIMSSQMMTKINGGAAMADVNSNHLLINGVQSGCVNLPVEAMDPVQQEQTRLNAMRSMARLRLEAETKELQKDAWVPVYLVPDLSALVDRLHVLKQLVGAQKFVVVVTTITIQTLDRMKKDSGQARETIRWLENCMQRGTTRVRAQKDAETAAIQDPEELTQETLALLQCCSSLCTAVTSRGATVATLLTGHKPKSTPFKAYADAIANRAIHGVTVANAHEFNRRWQDFSRRLNK